MTGTTVRPLLLFSLSLLLAGQAPPAQADTMYKCVGANGKVAYSDMPCPGQAKAAREFDVPAPETEEESRERLAMEKERLRAADAAFRQRHYSRQQALDARIRRGNGEGRYASGGDSSDYGSSRNAGIGYGTPSTRSAPAPAKR